MEKGKIFTYETQSVTTLLDPEESGALNTDKITLKPGASFQFKAYDALGKPVTTIPISWGVEGYPGNKMSRKATVNATEGGKAWATVDVAEEEAYVLLFAEAKEGYKLDRKRIYETNVIPIGKTALTSKKLKNKFDVAV